MKTSDFLIHKKVRKSLSVRRQGLLILAIPVTCLMTSLATFGWLQLDMITDETMVQRDQQGDLEIKRLLTNLTDAQRGVQLYELTQREQFLDAYQTATIEIPQALSMLRQLVQDTPQQQKRLEKIERLTQRDLALMANILMQAKVQEGEPGPSAMVAGWLDSNIIDQTLLQIEQFAAEEQQIFDEHKQRLNSHQQVALILVLGFVATGVVGVLFAVQLLFRLDGQLMEREASLHQANQKLQLINEQLQRFTANASHELRTPLAAVLSHAQVGLLAPPEDSVQPRKRLEKIVELTKLMSKLVSDLLFLARYEEILLPDSLKKEINLVELLSQLSKDYTDRAFKRKLHFISQLPNYPLRFTGEPDLLRQAIINLLDNALRYTPPGGYIQLRLVSQCDCVLIEVEDNGIGIPAESLPRIFEQFYRVDQTHSNKSSGFGLGLALTQRIAQIHSGHVHVTSTIGQGSLFQIELPLQLCPIRQSRPSTLSH